MAKPLVEFDLDPRSLAKIKAAFDELPKGPARRAVNKATREAGNPLLRAVKRLAPKDTKAMASETTLRNFRARSPFGGAFVATPSRKKLAGEHRNSKGRSTKRQDRIRNKRGKTKSRRIMTGTYYYPAVVEKRTPFMIPALRSVSGMVRSMLPGAFVDALEAEVQKYRAKKGLK